MPDLSETLQVTPHNRIAAACACLYHPATETVLLAKRGPTMSHPGTWCVPGGKAEPGDGYALGTALRELREETGVLLDGEAARPFTELVHVIPRGSGVEGQIKALYFLAPQQFDAKADGVEVTDVEWVSLAYVLANTAPTIGLVQPGSAIQLIFLKSWIAHAGSWADPPVEHIEEGPE